MVHSTADAHAETDFDWVNGGGVATRIRVNVFPCDAEGRLHLATAASGMWAASWQDKNGTVRYIENAARGGYAFDSPQAAQRAAIDSATKWATSEHGVGELRPVG